MPSMADAVLPMSEITPRAADTNKTSFFISFLLWIRTPQRDVNITRPRSVRPRAIFVAVPQYQTHVKHCSCEPSAHPVYLISIKLSSTKSFLSAQSDNVSMNNSCNDAVLIRSLIVVGVRNFVKPTGSILKSWRKLADRRWFTKPLTTSPFPTSPLTTE
jgi:hypothetical protein